MDRIEQIAREAKALHAEATQGEWFWNHVGDFLVVMSREGEPYRPEVHVFQPADGDYATGFSFADGRFCAHAGNHYVELADEVLRTRAQSPASAMSADAPATAAVPPWMRAGFTAREEVFAVFDRLNSREGVLPAPAWTREVPTEDGWYWLRQAPNPEPFVREVGISTIDGAFVHAGGELRPWNDRTEHWPVRLEPPK